MTRQLSSERSEINRLKDELARRGQISLTPLELSPIYQEWESFEFVTKKKGASGPTKTECLSYYEEKYVYLYKVNLLWIRLQGHPIFLKKDLCNIDFQFEGYNCWQLFVFT